MNYNSYKMGKGFNSKRAYLLLEISGIFFISGVTEGCPLDRTMLF